MSFSRLALIGTTVFALLASAGNVKAASGEAEAGATIIDSLSIVKSADLDIGSIVPSTSVGGVVRIAPEGNAECDAVLTCLTQTTAPARFAVQGNAGYVYAVTLPTVVVMSNGSKEMQVTALTSSTRNGGLLDSDGLDELSVGGSVMIDANQETGQYTGQFHVTVEYN